MNLKEKSIDLLRWSEKYTETDMVYLAKGSFWLLLGKGVMFLIAFAKMIAFGRLIPQETYGTYNFILAVVGIFMIASLPGIDTAVIRSIARKKEGTFITGLKARLRYSTIGSLGLLLLSFWYLFNQNQQLGLSFLIAAATLPFFYSFTIFSSFWIGRKRFDIQNKYEMISSFFIGLSVVIALFLTDNIVFIIATFFISESILNGIFLKKTLKAIINKEEDEEAITFGKSLTFINAINQFATHIDKIIIWKFLGPIQLAIYSFALLPSQKFMGLMPISQLALPKLGEQDLRGKEEGIIKKIKKLFVVTSLITIILIISAPYIYGILFPNYLESVPYFQALSLLVFLYPLNLIGVSFVSQMKKRELYITRTATPIIKIALFLVLIPFFQIWGIILSIIATQIIAGILSLHFFLKPAKEQF